jgi:hypothetical protein
MQCKQCIYIYIYINAEMIPVETVPGIKGGGWGESSGGGIQCDLFDTL